MTRTPSAARIRRRTMTWPAYGVTVFTVAALLVLLVTTCAAVWDAIGPREYAGTVVTVAAGWLVLCLPLGWLIGRRDRLESPPRLRDCGARDGYGGQCRIPVVAGPASHMHAGTPHFDPNTGRSWR